MMKVVQRLGRALWTFGKAKAEQAFAGISEPLGTAGSTAL
jgi:hypothetical protein